MSPHSDRRAALIESLADHLLAHGLGNAGLRPLARAAGTSDRMLLYYFADKVDLLGSVLAVVAGRMLALLDAAIPASPPRSRDALLAELWHVLGSPPLRPFLAVWLNLVAAAARGEQPQASVAGGLIGGFEAWVAARLTPGPESAGDVARVLAMSDGFMLLAAAGRQDLVTAALGG
jgi:AcrR family transcriptional regulator